MLVEEDDDDGWHHFECRRVDRKLVKQIGGGGRNMEPNKE